MPARVGEDECRDGWTGGDRGERGRVRVLRREQRLIRARREAALDELAAGRRHGGVERVWGYRWRRRREEEVGERRGDRGGVGREEGCDFRGRFGYDGRGRVCAGVEADHGRLFAVDAEAEG